MILKHWSFTNGSQDVLSRLSFALRKVQMQSRVGNISPSFLRGYFSLLHFLCEALVAFSFFLPSDRCESDWLTIDRPKGRSERRKLDRCFLSLPFALRWLFVGRKARSLDSLEQTKRLSLFLAQMVRLLLNARVDPLLHNETNILALFFFFLFIQRWLDFDDHDNFHRFPSSRCFRLERWIFNIAFLPYCISICTFNKVWRPSTATSAHPAMEARRFATTQWPRRTSTSSGGVKCQSRDTSACSRRTFASRCAGRQWLPEPRSSWGPACLRTWTRSAELSSSRTTRCRAACWLASTTVATTPTPIAVASLL